MELPPKSDEDVVFEAMAESGIRGFSGKAMMDRGTGVPKGLRETTRESLRGQSGASLRRRVWRPRSPFADAFRAVAARGRDRIGPRLRQAEGERPDRSLAPRGRGD